MQNKSRAAQKDAWPAADLSCTVAVQLPRLSLQVLAASPTHPAGAFGDVIDPVPSLDPLNEDLDSLARGLLAAPVPGTYGDDFGCAAHGAYG